MSGFDPSTYGPMVTSILKESRLMPLGPGSPNSKLHTQLSALTMEKIFCDGKIRDQDMAKCCLAALWLYHDFLDESHTLSQEIHSTSGSYWHGIMHRREPDYANAKYWFQRVGNHPVFDGLATDAKQIAKEDSAEAAKGFHRQDAWDSFMFVDLCEKSAGSESEMLCRRIQQREWELLFEYCYREALRKK